MPLFLHTLGVHSREAEEYSPQGHYYVHGDWEFATRITQIRIFCLSSRYIWRMDMDAKAGKSREPGRVKV
jgi:hypothetical protein